MKEYMLEYGELYIIPEPLTKNRTCQTVRWKQLAMSDDLEALKKHLGPYCRIIDKKLNVVAKHVKQLR